jgi:hypothetical protein
MSHTADVVARLGAMPTHRGSACFTLLDERCSRHPQLIETLSEISLRKTGSVSCFFLGFLSRSVVMTSCFRSRDWIRMDTGLFTGT